MSTPTDPRDEVAKRDLALRDLARLERQGESLGGTAMDQASKNVNGKEQEDHIDRLGKRIGRGIAYALLPIAIWYFGRTSGWW